MKGRTLLVELSLSHDLMKCYVIKVDIEYYYFNFYSHKRLKISKYLNRSVSKVIVHVYMCICKDYMYMYICTYMYYLQSFVNYRNQVIRKIFKDKNLV